MLMELFVGISLLLGLFMNCYLWFDIGNKARLDINLSATRTIIRSQVVFNTLNVTFHLVLLIPWPFWGYFVNPSSQMWTVPSIVCRLLSAVGQTASFACAINAISIVVVTRKAQDRCGRERIALLLIWITTFGSIVLSIVYIILLPLVMFQSWSWCPASSLLLMYDQQEVKSVYGAYVVLSVILFFSLCFTRKSHIPGRGGSLAWKIFDACIMCVFLVCTFITVIIIVFAGAFIALYLFGGTLISGVFNIVNLYFSAAILALSISSPPLIFGCNSTNKVLLHSLLPVIYIKKTTTVDADDQLQE